MHCFFFSTFARSAGRENGTLKLALSPLLLSNLTVRAPASLAALATDGAAPVPVPPPIPAVMNTRSAPATARATSAADSCAAAAPSEGSPPVPRPRVSSAPSWSLLRQEEDSRAWASVLTAQNSTPWEKIFYFWKGEREG